MTTEPYTAERDYRLSMSIAHSMLNNGLLTKKEYKKIDTIMTKSTSLFWVTIREKPLDISRLLL